MLKVGPVATLSDIPALRIARTHRTDRLKKGGTPDSQPSVARAQVSLQFRKVVITTSKIIDQNLRTSVGGVPSVPMATTMRSHVLASSTRAFVRRQQLDRKMDWRASVPRIDYRSRA
jgi:hypothetical protein